MNHGLHSAGGPHPQGAREKNQKSRKQFQNQNLGLLAAVTEEDKSKLSVEDEPSDKPWKHLPKAEPRAGQWPVVLRLSQATKGPDTASAASLGLPPGDRD